MQSRCFRMDIANSNHSCCVGVDPLDSKMKLGFDIITAMISVEKSDNWASSVSMAKSQHALFCAALG